MKQRTIKLPDKRKVRVYRDRHAMKAGHPTARMRFPSGLVLTGNTASVALPIDWTRGGTLAFAMDDNDTLGDCMVAAAEHIDGALTGCQPGGAESVFSDTATSAWYEALSGGDNGLDEGQLVTGWKGGLPGTPAAVILDALDVDPTNAQLMQFAMFSFGPPVFMLALPDAWYTKFVPGMTWDAGKGVVANPNSGHGVMWSQCSATGIYRVQTWGTWCLLTPAGVAICDPSAFAVFSPRMFDAAGYAGNGQHVSVLAPLWVASGGSSVVLSIVANYPPPSGPPTPTPTPLPSSAALILAEHLAAGGYTVSAVRKNQVPALTLPQAVNAGTYTLAP